jgi:CxxC motif-containing protein (DUF1111 family)
MQPSRTGLCIGIVLSSTLVTGAWAANTNPSPSSSHGTYGLSGFGMPLDGLKSADLQTFVTGQFQFTEVDSIPRVGPVFNNRSCAGCHFQPTLGGSGEFINEIRVRNSTTPGPLHIFAVDNLLRGGSQTQGQTAIFPEGMAATPLGCQITAPGCQRSACQTTEADLKTFTWELPICDPTSASFKNGDNCVAERQAGALFGFGLVEAVSDKTLQNLAAQEPDAIRGTAKMVTELGAQRVGRFGWKDDHATLRAFSGDAYLNEIGITNPDNPTEVSQCAMNQTQYGLPLQVASSDEDPPDTGGRADVDRFTDFMRAMAPPPQLPSTSSSTHGAQVFHAAGCDGCHTPSLQTDSNPSSFIPASTGGAPTSSTLAAKLSNQTFQPFSDFLLHDMGSLGDGITSGDAGPTMIRTAPLWGVRAKSRLLHDGRAVDLATAISLHDGQGKAASQAFGALSASDSTDLLNFLGSI